MSIPSLSSLYYSTMLANNSAAGVFNSNQARMGLANSVTGAESPGQMASLADMDKALTFKGTMDKTNYEVALAMQQEAQKQLKREQQMRQRLMEAGAILA
jgi:hypothetical protein